MKNRAPLSRFAKSQLAKLEDDRNRMGCFEVVAFFGLIILLPSVVSLVGDGVSGAAAMFLGIGAVMTLIGGRVAIGLRQRLTRERNPIFRTNELDYRAS